MHYLTYVKYLRSPIFSTNRPTIFLNSSLSHNLHLLPLYCILIFVWPCVVSIILISWPKRWKFLVYLFIPNQLYMFRAMFLPIIRSTLLYLQLLIYSTYVAAGWSLGRDGTLFPSRVHDTGRQQHRWNISEAVNTVMCSWWWAKTSPETCRTDWVQINK